MRRNSTPPTYCPLAPRRITSPRIKWSEVLLRLELCGAAVSRIQYKAAVISTYQDLKHHRANAIGVLERSGFYVDPMEKWDSFVQEPSEFCQERLEGCHLCILLVGRRRGYRKPGSEFSITQQEYYHAARTMRIDVLPFFLDDRSVWPKEWDERAEDDELSRWCTELRQNHGASSAFTDSPESVVSILAPSLNRWVQQQGPKSALRLYLKDIAVKHGVIRLDDFGGLADLSNVEIHRLFVEPRISSEWVSPDADPDAWPCSERLVDAIAERFKVVLLGDPGSGKSTLVDWITWQFAAHHMVGNCEWVDALGHLVPMPLILRDMEIGTGITWELLLDAFVKRTAGGQLTLVDVPSLLRDGQAFLLLDGLDEVGQLQSRRDLRDAVLVGMSAYPKCRWLLTSRLVGYDEVPYHSAEEGRRKRRHNAQSFRNEKSERLRGDRTLGLGFVAPFDDQQVHRFTENWFRQRESYENTVRVKTDEFIEAVRATLPRPA